MIGYGVDERVSEEDYGKCFSRHAEANAVVCAEALWFQLECIYSWKSERETWRMISMSGKSRLGLWRKWDQKIPNPTIKFTVSRELFTLIEKKLSSYENDRRGMAEIGRELFSKWVKE